MTRSFRLETPKLRGDVFLTGALLTNVSFRLPSGRWVEPLAKANWPPDPALPGHMQRLGGEFFCLPFGGGGTVRDPAPGWESLATGPFDAPMHGPCANAEWTLVEHLHDRITLSLRLPDTLPVESVERTIAFSSEEARFESRISILARRSGRVPVAFHPILQLPKDTGQLELRANFSQGFTYPAVILPDRMASEPGRMFNALGDVPGRNGGRVDLSRLPSGERVEDVILLAGMTGSIFAMDASQRFIVEIDWSRNQLPHCMIWIHDRGNDDPPWNGAFRGLGIELMAAAFDGPWDVSVGRNPLNQTGYATSVSVEKGERLALTLSLTVTEI